MGGMQIGGLHYVETLTKRVTQEQQLYLAFINAFVMIRFGILQPH